MPFIHIRTFSKKDLEIKQQTAQAMIKAASESMGAPETAFTVVYEEVERDNWESDVQNAIIEPLRDKMVVENGKLCE